jgi:hypothetical protein
MAVVVPVFPQDGWGVVVAEAAEAAKEVLAQPEPYRAVRLDRVVPQVIFLINLVIQVELVLQV